MGEVTTEVDKQPQAGHVAGLLGEDASDRVDGESEVL